MEKDNKMITDSLWDKLKSDIDDHDPNIQEKYFYLLDKIIDATALLRYESGEYDFLLRSINQVDSLIIEEFQKIDEEFSNGNTILNELANKLCIATKGAVEANHFLNRLIELYTIYINYNKELDEHFTTDFYNDTLNKQRDAHISSIKKELKQILTKELPLTEKMHNKLVTNAKFQRIHTLLKEKDYKSLKMTEEELKEKLQELHNHLRKIKLFKKNPQILSEANLKIIDELFISGNLNEESLIETLKESTDKERKMILNQYHKLLLPYLEHIEIEEQELDRTDVNFNYNHLQIVNSKNYYNRLEEFVSLLKKEEIEYVIENFEKLKPLFRLLPLTGLSNKFGVEEFKNIILNYDQIINNLKNTKAEKDISFQTIIDNLALSIRIGNIYGITDKYDIAILGKSKIKRILEKSKTSRNPKKYIEAYNAMLNNSISYIPPIKGTFQDYEFESGNNYDEEKLFIGLNRYNSCIEPEGDGQVAYHDCLAKPYSDVILIKKKDTSEYFGRAILYRKGNFVIIGPIQGTKEINTYLYNETFINEISRQILRTAASFEDAIDYVFLTATANFPNKDTNYPVLENEIFYKNLPHSDLRKKSCLIGSRKERIYLNPNEQVKAVYLKNRKKPEKLEKNCKEALLRIKALEISREKDEIKKEKLKMEYYFISKNDYKEAYVGQDWYVALTDIGKLEKTALKIYDPRQEEEIKRALTTLIDTYVETSSVGEKTVSSSNKALF